MPNTLIKMKTGTIAKMEQEQNGKPVVPLDEGSIYFAVDTDNDVGKILYDAPDGNGGVDRIVMNTRVEYADEAGLAYKAEKLQEKRSIDGVNFDGTAGIIHYGNCTTNAATVAKLVSCTNFVLGVGARIIVKFNNTNTASNPTLNVNDTGAKPIQHKGIAIQPQALSANGTYEFVYDGTA